MTECGLEIITWPKIRFIVAKIHKDGISEAQWPRLQAIAARCTDDKRGYLYQALKKMGYSHATLTYIMTRPARSPVRVTV